MLDFIIVVLRDLYQNEEVSPKIHYIVYIHVLTCVINVIKWLRCDEAAVVAFHKHFNNFIIIHLVNLFFRSYLLLSWWYWERDKMPLIFEERTLVPLLFFLFFFPILCSDEWLCNFLSRWKACLRWTICNHQDLHRQNWKMKNF